MECSEAEVLIGMKQHGALAGAQAVALDEHLAGCAGCRAFGETTHAMEAEMISNTSNAPALDFEQFTLRLRRQTTHERGAFGMLLLGIATQICLFQAIDTSAGEVKLKHLVAEVCVGFALVVLFFFLQQWRLSKLMRLRTNEELLATARKELDDRLRSKPGLALLCIVDLPILGALVFGIATETEMAGPVWKAVTALFALMTGVLFYFLFVTFPKMRRERDELQ